MEALQLFYKHAKFRTLIAIFFGAISGVFYAFLIPIVMASTTAMPAGSNIDILGIDFARDYLGFMFFLFCLLIIVFRTSSGVILARVSLDIRFQLRNDLYELIKKTSIASLERVGESRLIQVLSKDVAAIVSGAQVFPGLVINLVTLIGLLGYLAYLELNAFFYIAKVIVFGVATYMVPVHLARRYFTQSREHFDSLQESLKGLVCGAKELQLDSKKLAHFENESLIKEEAELRNLEKIGFTFHQLSENYGDLLCFFAIGGVAFSALGIATLSNEMIIPVVMVLLYISGPISILLNAITSLSMARVSLTKVQQLGKELPREASVPSIKPKNCAVWHTLTLKDVVYRYPGGLGHEVGFSVGPVNVQITPGQLVFITGGNGAGKSTLAKLISQHYKPSSGALFFGEQQIDDTNVVCVREQISCIYSDFYLFDRPFGIDLSCKKNTDSLNSYLKLFRLSNKVELLDNKFSTLKLSDGQRRRLALVVALVENKSLYVFDEWAADQDPEFRHIFYSQVLSELKARGKTVVVISHDDRYFHLADSVIVMEPGAAVNASAQTVDALCS